MASPRNEASLARFSLDLKKFAAIVQVDYDKVVRKIALDLLREIVMRTPVDTGRARASWNIQQGEPDTSVAPAGTALTGEGAAALALSKASSITGGSILAGRASGQTGIWITNSLPYIVALEHGHSKQAPYGMVRIATAKVAAGMLSAIGDATGGLA